MDSFSASSSPDKRMRDFVIPSFEEFQRLREQNRVKRQRLRRRQQQQQQRQVREITETGISPRQDSGKRFATPFQLAWRKDCDDSNDDDDDDDDSATEIGTVSSQDRNHTHKTALEARNNKRKDRDENGTNSITPDNMVAQRKQLTPNITTPRRTSPKVLPATRVPISMDQYSKKNPSLPMFPLAVGLPEQKHYDDKKKEETEDSSPEKDVEHKASRSNKPWFQRRRKPKLQQTRLSFSGVS